VTYVTLFERRADMIRLVGMVRFPIPLQQSSSIDKGPSFYLKSTEKVVKGLVGSIGLIQGVGRIYQSLSPDPLGLAHLDKMPAGC
jgi:hypothetical protein